MMQTFFERVRSAQKSKLIVFHLWAKIRCYKIWIDNVTPFFLFRNKYFSNYSLKSGGKMSKNSEFKRRNFTIALVFRYDSQTGCLIKGLENERIQFSSWPLYTGLTLIIFPTQNFELWAVWKNENHSVAAKPQTSQQGATLKSCIHNIRADSVRPVQSGHD